MRKKLIIANWKMNLSVSRASLLVHRLDERIREHRSVEVVLAPPMLTLQPLSLQIDRRKFRLCAQNAHPEDQGPLTGEVSFAMIDGIVHYALVGHSDRRYKFGEDSAFIQKKVTAAVRNHITPVLCVGETLQEKRDGETMQVVHDQVNSAMECLTAEEAARMVIAYEPVWALSSGHDYLHHETPKPDDIKRVVAAIRRTVAEVYGPKAAGSIRVLYGGSSNASTAHGLMSTTDVDGLLVGGASLNYAEFANIVDAAYQVAHQETENIAG
ncbi:triose-phosphate isomerase [Candidatus Saccharibacteria bacterium]|nr:MAG: triose-phosphate isomerase [Candidatus Saccharibacteria bacterium]